LYTLSKFDVAAIDLAESSFEVVVSLDGVQALTPRSAGTSIGKNIFFIVGLCLLYNTRSV
jgi:hypothetical protein